MTIRLTLPPDLEQRLRQEAERCGEPTESVALRLLDNHLPPPDARRAAAVAMLQQWIEEDQALTAEEAASNAAVLHSLDEHRPSYRKLFAGMLKDETP